MVASNSLADRHKEPGLLLRDNCWVILDSGDPVVVVLVRAIEGGDVASLRRLLNEDVGLSSARIRRRRGTQTPLHVATDWPGYFPGGPAVVRALLDAGADPNARTDGGPAPETPLHWAASTDDVDVADALIDGGADLEATGGSIGTPLDNAVGYGCWHVARRLVVRGTRVEKLWHAAALGMTRRVEELVAADPAPGQAEVDAAFWQACHGGQRRVAAYLLEVGADINAVPGYARRTALAAAGGPDTSRELLVSWLHEITAHTDGVDPTPH